jgi:outer membrane protein
MKMRSIVLAVSSLSALAAPAVQVIDDSGSWLLRGRALYLDPANKDDTGRDLSVNNKVFPELDLSNFLAPSMALELILTYPQKHDLRSGGTKIGTVKHLPPTLTFQYHFTGLPVRPYAGAGLNYNRFSNAEFDPAVEAAQHPTIKKNSFGPAADAGLDVPLGGVWLFNADVNYVQIQTKVYSSGTEVGTLKINPWLFSVGVGKRF